MTCQWFFIFYLKNNINHEWEREDEREWKKWGKEVHLRWVHKSLCCHYRRHIWMRKRKKARIMNKKLRVLISTLLTFPFVSIIAEFDAHIFVWLWLKKSEIFIRSEICNQLVRLTATVAINEINSYDLWKLIIKEISLNDVCKREKFTNY